VIAALLAASVPVLAAPARDPAAAIARRVERHYQRIKDFSGALRPDVHVPDLGNVKNATARCS